MMSIIKTAIITIVISFISGLLLDYYRNLAPRILCNIGKCVPIKINNKKIYEYIITVRNISNKIIRQVTLNIQSSQNNLKIEGAKITKGLKFDSLIKDNIFDVNIPFLSKNDEFSVTVCVENQRGVRNKPVIIIRSPENFKEVNSVEHKRFLSLLFNIPKNINKENREIFHRNKKPSKNKKAMIIAVSAILVIIIGALTRFYLSEMPSSTQTDVQKQSTDAAKSANGTTKNTDAKTSTDETTKNADATKSTVETTGSTDTNTSTVETSGNTDATKSTDRTTENTDIK
ncbi:hypothetical protein [Clostridium vincentii]|uniref:Uncharacterized protein n=1 Tax=Clostridium vincentii TaxID=52704 RepID=A0A2T0B528_9CLOT|nr:hypothetical protein [Clostridium vincentii]PRR78990.1 hypothetical protein CLVI_34190 [Clostridium vincentii]